MAPHSKGDSPAWDPPRAGLRLVSEDDRLVIYKQSRASYRTGAVVLIASIVTLSVGILLTFLAGYTCTTFAVILVCPIVGWMGINGMRWRSQVVVDKTNRRVELRSRYGASAERSTVLDSSKVQSVRFEVTATQGPRVTVEGRDGAVYELDAFSSTKDMRALAERLSECLSVPLDETES